MPKMSATTKARRIVEITAEIRKLSKRLYELTTDRSEYFQKHYQQRKQRGGK